MSHDLGDTVGLWQKVSEGSLSEVVSSLKKLAAHRHQLGKISGGDAAKLLAILHKPFGDSLQIEACTAALLLLAWWARSLPHAKVHLDQSNSGASFPEDYRLLLEAVQTAVQLVSTSGSPPHVLAAVVLFLGSAAAGCQTDVQHICYEVVCGMLSSHGRTFYSSGCLQDVIGGASILITTDTTGQRALWVMACLLKIWSSAETPDPSQDLASGTGGVGVLDSNTADSSIEGVCRMYNAMRTVGANITRSHSRDEASARLLSFARIIHEGTTSSQRLLQAASVCSAGGLLEGVSHGSSSLGTADPAVLLLDNLVLESCENAAAAVRDAAAPMAQGSCAEDIERILLWRDAAGYACCQVFLACHRPRPTSGTLACLRGALLHGALSLRGVFSAAQSERTAAEAGAWLNRHLQGTLTASAPQLTRSIAEQYRSAGPGPQQETQLDLQEMARHFHEGYQSYVLLTPRNWVQAMDGAAMQQMLDKIFLAAILLLATMWEVASVHRASVSNPAKPRLVAPDAALVAFRILNTLSFLQLCRMRLTSYYMLLHSVLETAASAPEACVDLLLSMPSYAALIAPVQDGRPAWLADTVLMTRMQFMMSVMAPCVGNLPKGKAVDVALPVTYLYMQHPHEPIRSQSHILFCSILRHAEAKEELVPFYVHRTLEGFPSMTSVDGLGYGVGTICKVLPVGSPMTTYTIDKVAHLCQATLQSREPNTVKSGLDLTRILAKTILAVDHQVLPSAMDAISSLARACPPSVGRQVCLQIASVLEPSDDYSRKASLVRWYQELAASVASHNEL
eukprot:jgi/Botrbrau1/22990/Bobra.0030s0054.1